MNNKPYQTGLSLVEIMIALLIGLFLLGGVLQIFSNSQQTYRMQQNLSRLQENGRFAIDFLAHDSRMASYWGCMARSNGDISGTNGATGTPDSITVQGAFVLTPTGSCGSPANAANSCCTTDPGLTANSCPVANLTNCYTDPTSTITYLITTPQATANMPTPNLTLYRNTNNTANPLIEGIQDMQILYGADTDTDGAANYYVPAGTAGLNMEQVVSIRISLLAFTLDDNLTAQPMAYTYNGVTTPSPDHKIRRVFNATIALRNRLQ